jgi:hypothetical protein
MTFAFACLCATGTDEAERFFTLHEAHHEQSALMRITDDHLAVFADGMVWIVFDASKVIVEYGLRLRERHSVLAEITALLFRIPVE